jgi:3-hydroxyacyl-[acyl-carrier-protein] dehydratase
MEELKLPLLYSDIIELLPHRYPFLFVDRVIEYVPDEKIVGLKNVSINEPFFQGHFPNNPIVPGVLQVEALAQMGALYAKLYKPEARDSLIVLAGLEKVKFRKQVVPGDTLRLEMGECRRKLSTWKMVGKVVVDGEVVCDAVFRAYEMKNTPA